MGFSTSRMKSVFQHYWRSGVEKNEPVEDINSEKGEQRLLTPIKRRA
jgi:hypothetical protein